MTKKNLVIYHANCVDGFTAAWAASKFLGEEDTEYLPYNYNVDPPASMNFIKKNVYIVDFSFNRVELAYICHAANFVVVLDHHKTAQEALESWLDKPANLTIVFDMKRSGAGITWDWFRDRSDDYTKAIGARPSLISYVEDRDLWKFVLPQSKEINAFISNVERSFEAYDLIVKGWQSNADQYSHTGSYLLAQHQSICEDILLLARPITINGHQGLCSNCPGHFASEVGSLLAQKSGTFGASFFQDSKGHLKFSLRSIGDFDVSEIAKGFGGGGHKNAAGFTLEEFGPGDREEINLWSTKAEG